MKDALGSLRPVRIVAQWVSFARMTRGRFARTCNICGYEGRFASHGAAPRPDARCPKCLSLERHRTLALAIAREGLVAARDTVLHFAPEAALGPWIGARAGQYRTADLKPGCDLTLDIEAIDLPDASVDVAIACHVLEHVDDRAALAGLFRVLKPGGRALLMVPVVEGWAETHEDPAIADAAGRALHFGQANHLRLYGRDVRDRIADAGFACHEFTPSPQDCAAHGLIAGEKVFVCIKPDAKSSGAR